jgi:hypothetical protein
LRAEFVHGQYRYDLPITDVNFIEKYTLNEAVLEDANHVFLSISLGIEFEERYYKLVAGIVWF